jgi:hypothetical protein
MLLLAVLGAIAIVVALGSWYDITTRRKGARSDISKDVDLYHLSHLKACQQRVWTQPNVGREPRR